MADSEEYVSVTGRMYVSSTHQGSFHMQFIDSYISVSALCVGYLQQFVSVACLCSFVCSLVQLFVVPSVALCSSIYGFAQYMCSKHCSLSTKCCSFLQCNYIMFFFDSYCTSVYNTYYKCSTITLRNTKLNYLKCSTYLGKKYVYKIVCIRFVSYSKYICVPMLEQIAIVSSITKRYGMVTVMKLFAKSLVS